MRIDDRSTANDCNPERVGDVSGLEQHRVGCVEAADVGEEACHILVVAHLLTGEFHVILGSVLACTEG